MSLILDGTNGLSDIDGSAATPAIRGTDANTGIFFPAADTIAFSEGGSEAMRIDSSGNVGIGTASPNVKFEISSTSVATARISSSQTSPNNILMTGGSSYNYGVIGVNTGNNTSTGDIFQLGYTASAGAAPTSVLQWSSAAKCIGLNTNPSTTGTGITFPATQSASTNANTLDDYEEGTWTPVYSFSVSGAAAVVSNGIYIKIGSSVWVQGYLYISSSTTCSGDATITGLPFTSNTTSRTNQGFSIGVARRFNVDMPNLRIALVNNTTVLNLFKQATNSNGETTLTNTDFNVQAEFNILYFQGTYSV